jgi:outer membrane protein OmpA-like peptidoglycan-associated protein
MKRRSLIPFAALALCAHPLTAQSTPASTAAAEALGRSSTDMSPGIPGVGAGTVEFGLFIQPTYLGAKAQFDFNGQMEGLDSRGVTAFGARLGVFITPTWSLELDAVGAEPRAEGGRSVDFRALSMRANYNFTMADFGPRTSMLVGAGVTRVEFTGGDPRTSSDKWGASALAGLRFNVGGPISLRGDIVADYIPAALNVGARMGIGVLFGSRGAGSGAGTQQQPVYVEPAPVTPPQQPVQPPTIDEEENRDAALAGVDTIPLSRSIFFDYDQIAIRPDAVPVLETKLRWLEANPRLVLRIEGHADDRGQDEYNLSLSQRRAAETQAWFMARGVSAERLPIVGYGEEYPLCLQDPMTDPCHQMNRRADFRIMRVGGPRLVPPR